MKMLRIRFLSIACVAYIAALGPLTASANSAKTAAPATSGISNKIVELEWDELVPVQDREKFSTSAAPIHDYLGEGGPAAQQPMDFGVNKSLDGKTIKLPGFIVPLDIGKDGLVSEFFLVPYFGACIHVPPPPPNQIVYVRIPQGIALDSIYEAYWITGKLSVQNKQTRLGAAAYSVVADKIEIYKY
ncbi:MAG: DUF3299 domain-containing protein [Pseudomonadales bacterium]|nr:DUF3299 domain-containing protein [Pseudomonadales bacterium]